MFVYRRKQATSHLACCLRVWTGPRSEWSLEYNLQLLVSILPLKWFSLETRHVSCLSRGESQLLWGESLHKERGKAGNYVYLSSSVPRACSRWPRRDAMWYWCCPEQYWDHLVAQFQQIKICFPMHRLMQKLGSWKKKKQYSKNELHIHIWVFNMHNIVVFIEDHLCVWASSSLCIHSLVTFWAFRNREMMSSQFGWQVSNDLQKLFLWSNKVVNIVLTSFILLNCSYRWIAS